MISPALFGILQLDKGEPLGFANVSGLVQAWLQDAGGFGMVGLVVYLLYAMATPTDKSQSEKIRVPVSQWMVIMAGLALLCYAGCAALLLLENSGRRATLFGVAISAQLPPPIPGAPNVSPPPIFRTELIPILLMIAGTFALLGIGEPFARDCAKIARRNLSLGFTGVRRVLKTVGTSTSSAFTGRRGKALIVGLVAYGILGVALYSLGANQLFGIWSGWLFVAIAVLVCAILVTMLFEAEGPVWAIAKLSFKEASRSGLLWIFLLVLIPFAFRNVWMATTKPVDEIRRLVDVTNGVLAIFLLASAGLLASFFGIPNDIKNLNIYTVVSKPINRFEIVLGRFVGYVSLMTLALIALTGVSLVLIANTSLSEKAREETYKARVPLRGKLEFKSRKVDFEGTNVGREFEYRKYIAGHQESPQRAVWNYSSIPSGLASAEGDRVPVEFTFDIYKMTKGEQNRGVGVTFRFVSHQTGQRPPILSEGGEWQWLDKAKEEEYQNEVKALEAKGMSLGGALPGTPAWTEVNRLAEKYGFFEVRGKEVFDFVVMGIEVPAGLFRAALQGDPGQVDDKRLGKKQPAPRMSVYVKCESGGQLLGMAEPDLYLLEYEQPFALNYIKGMIGVWCWLCIVIGLAVACSTYLSSVLCLLATAVIFGFGFFPEHLNDVATNRNVGGGPFESMSRMLKAEQPTTPLSDSAVSKSLTLFDRAGAWFFRRIQNVIPDAESFNWTQFVSEGFNINTQYLVVNLLVTFGYLLPWAILAYYLMKSREVAA